MSNETEIHIALWCLWTKCIFQKQNILQQFSLKQPTALDYLAFLWGTCPCEVTTDINLLLLKEFSLKLFVFCKRCHGFDIFFVLFKPSEAAQERGSLPESRPGPSSTLTSPRVHLSPTLALISQKVQSHTSPRFHTESLGPHGQSPTKGPVLNSPWYPTVAWPVLHWPAWYH